MRRTYVECLTTVSCFGTDPFDRSDKSSFLYYSLRTHQCARLSADEDLEWIGNEHKEQDTSTYLCFNVCSITHQMMYHRSYPGSFESRDGGVVNIVIFNSEKGAVDESRKKCLSISWK